MKMIDINEARANLEDYAKECQQSPVIVTVGGIPTFEMVPIRDDDPDFMSRLIENNAAFRRLCEESKRQVAEGRVSSLADVRRRLLGEG